MPKEVYGSDFVFLPQSEVLTFEEITRLATLFAGLGVSKVRITGGEPLVRRDVSKLVVMLADVPGVDDLTMTTNGALLRQFAGDLKQAGLKRVTVSLDSLRDDVFQQMNDVHVPVAAVLGGIEAAASAGFKSVKVNMVVKRGLNDADIVEMARHFRGTGHVLRFIEYMDVGTTNGWRTEDVVSADEILQRISAEFPLEPIEPHYRGEVAGRYRYLDGAGEIGIISSVTQPFCGDCTRARLSADGKLYTCLFSSVGHDLRSMMRRGATDDDLLSAITGVWRTRSDRYSELRTAETAHRPKVEMSFIGG